MFCPNAVVWGDAATWFTGVFTMLAVVIAAAVYVTGEVTRRRGERRSQAAMVSAWIPQVSITKRSVVEIDDDGYQRTTDETDEISTVNLALVNNSHGVVYTATAVFSSESYFPPVEYVDVGNVGPGMWEIGIPLPPNNEMPDAAVDLYFTDQRGVSWRRRSDGQLVESPSFEIPPMAAMWSGVLKPLGYASDRRT